MFYLDILQGPPLTESLSELVLSVKTTYEQYESTCKNFSN